ncbi:hypothetical protein ACFWP7_30875 [Streptomyces sp. NPDC058470]
MAGPGDDATVSPAPQYGLPPDALASQRPNRAEAHSRTEPWMIAAPKAS